MVSIVSGVRVTPLVTPVIAVTPLVTPQFSDTQQVSLNCGGNSKCCFTSNVNSKWCVTSGVNSKGCFTSDVPTGHDGSSKVMPEWHFIIRQNGIKMNLAYSNYLVTKVMPLLFYLS